MYKMSYRILVFSWNTQSIPLSETLDVEVAEYNRSSSSTMLPGITTWRHSYNIPDFYPKLRDIIRQHTPDIIVIGFQEDRFPGSYFHSHLLPEEFPKLGYALVKRTKLMGVGVTTYKGLLQGDLFERGIRTSVYATNKLAAIIEKEEHEMRTVIGNDGQAEYVCSSSLTRSKGATVSYLMIPGVGRLAFICCHLPFNARSLIIERLHKNQMLRQNELNQTNICFNNIIEQLILLRAPVPSYVIYFGDFNYRVADMRSAEEVAEEFSAHSTDENYLQRMYEEHDELHEQMRRRNIYEFSEGVDNSGPRFLPTGKMVKNRYIAEDNSPNEQMINEPWETGKADQRVPSWCDRILYHKFSNSERELQCTLYDRFDVGETMAKSDHAAVLALFTL